MDSRPAAADAKKAALRFPDWPPAEMRSPAIRFVARLDGADAQIVIDEWVGALAAGVIQRSPRGYLKTLAVRWRAGDMSLRYAGVVAPLS